jgi:hypothetical protein
MKITLRKASALQTTIQTALNAVVINTQVEVNEFQDVEAQLVQANSDLMTNDVRRSDLLMSLYTIRSVVGQANAQAGITSRLTHAAFIDKRLAQLDSMNTPASRRLSLDVIKGKLEKIKARPADSRASIYGRDDEVSTGVLTETQSYTIREIVQDLRKQKQELNDEILELNIKTEVEISEEITVILQREGII